MTHSRQRTTPRILVTICIVMALAGALKLAAASNALTLAEAAKPSATIVRAAGASASEQTAAAELASYLHQITGAAFQVQLEDKTPTEGSRVFVGPTAFAKSQGLTAEKLGPEEWIIRTVGRDLIIIGGQPRGTFYGVCHFLEDVLGVHWWNPFEETVPQNKTVSVKTLNSELWQQFAFDAAPVIIR